MFLQTCEAQEREKNADVYEERRRAAERAAKTAKASRDAKADKRRQEDEPLGGEVDTSATTFDEDAVLPEFSLAGGAWAWDWGGLHASLSDCYCRWDILLHSHVVYRPRAAPVGC